MNLATVITTQLQHTLTPVISRFIQPLNLSRVATRMPQRLNQLVVEKLLNGAFAEQLADGDFEFLEDRILQVEILDAGLFIGLSYVQNRITCNRFSRDAGESDVTLSVDTLNAIKLVQQEVDPDTLFFQRKLKINGDTELAHHVKNTIDTLNPELIPQWVMRLVDEYKVRVLL